MARKKESKFSPKLSVMTKLYESGCKTEKELMALSIETVLKMENITVPEMVIILEIQKNVKAHTLFSYLGQDGEPHNEVDS